MNDQPLILMARHGQTMGNLKGVFRSRLDFPLDPKGEQEANELGQHIAQNYKPTLIVSSPMKRAVATSGQVAQHVKAPVESDARLLPWHAGLLMGQKRTPKSEAVRDFYIRHAGTPIPGGESITESEKRMHSILQASLHYAQKGGLPLLVTHGSGIKAAQTLITGHREPTGDSALVEPGGLAGIFRGPKGLEIRPLFKGAKAQVAS